MNRQWQANQTDLNHDWPKHHHLRRLTVVISRVEDGAHDVGRLKVFTEPDWWPVEELLSLPKDDETFETEARIVARAYIELAAKIGGRS